MTKEEIQIAIEAEKLKIKIYNELLALLFGKGDKKQNKKENETSQSNNVVHPDSDGHIHRI